MKKILVFILMFTASLSFAQRETLVVPDGPGDVQDMAIDKEQKYLYTLNHSKAVMWEIATGKQLFTFYLDGENVNGIAVSNDGKKVAIAGEFKNYCFSTVTGKLIFKDQKYGGISNGIIFSPDDKMIYIGRQGIVEIDANTGNSSNKMTGNNSGEGKHFFYIDNNTKLVVPGGGNWEVYDIAKHVKLYSFDCGGLNYITALPQQGYIIAGINHNAVKVFDIRTGKEIKELAGDSYDAVVIPSENSNQLIFCPDGVDKPQRLLYNTNDFTVEKKFTRKISSVNNSFFLGKEHIAYVIDGGKLVKLNTQDESIVKTYEGMSADFGSETFSSLEYNRNSGVLHLTTDENNLKSIDLYRMKPIRHTAVNTGISNLAFSPSGDTIASFSDTYSNMTIKNIVNAKVIKPATNISSAALNRNLYFFSPNANQLYYPQEDVRDDRTTIIKYSMQAKTALPALKTRRLDNVFVNSDKDMLAAVEWAYQTKTTFGVWNISTGKRLLNVPVADEDSKVRYITVSKDKKFALAMQESKLYYYDLSTGQLISTSAVMKRTEATGTFDADPASFGVSAASSDLSLYAFSRADPDINVRGELFLYKRSGELVYRINAHSDDIRSILFSPDDKIIYTVASDQSIKIWDTQTGKLIGTLYLFKDSNDFVFIDPEGRFDGSDEGLKRLYFIRNREPLPLDRLFEKYYYPNLYARIINGEKFDPIPADIIKPSPTVSIAYAAVQRNLEVSDDMPTYQNTTGAAEITVTANADDDAVDEIRLFHNGKIVTLVTRNLIVEDDKTRTAVKKYIINLLPGQNSIRAVALNTQRTESDPDEIAVIYSSGANTNTDTKPVNNNTSNTPVVMIDKNATMHLIVVGINAYQNKSMSLNYALADAAAFKDEVEKDAKTVISNVKTYFVTDNNADKKGIENAFTAVQQNAKPEDVFVFYYAGHGVIGKNNEFYLVPTDVSDLKNVQTELENKGIAAKLLQQYAINIQAQKQLFILDACQSAGAFEAMLSNDANQQKNIAVVARSTGTHWMAASGAQQFANEFASLGHGAFTYVLLQALKGAALNNKMITVNNLKNYLQQTVPELMRKYHGTPQYPASYGFGNDFPVEVMK